MQLPRTEALASIADWLACPHCSGAVAIAGNTLRCGTGHSFDIARQGYVNLLVRAAPANADTVAMLEARARFLAAGHYEPIAAAVSDAVAGERLLEVGAGTGYYAATVLDRHPGMTGLATDISPAAARRAARAHPRLAAAVADTWAGLPLVDGAVDTVICVFAPRNATEFARVLRPGGRLVVATPGVDHLASLRRQHGLLDVRDDKLEELRDRLSPSFEPLADRRVTHGLDLPATDVADVISMGPNAFHGTPRDVASAATAVDVTVSLFGRR